MTDRELRSILSLAVGLSAALSGCAESVPGISPPGDQLHYPIGMVLAPGATGDKDRLIVASSNFDQRFNAGSLSAFSVDRLAALLPAPSDMPLGDESNTCSVPAAGFLDAFFSQAHPDSALINRVRVHQLGGELVYAPVQTSVGKGLVFVTGRTRNRLTMVALKDDGSLDCTSAGLTGHEEPAFDCSDLYMVSTGSVDPYSLSYSPRTGSQGVVAVGHLRAERTSNGSIATVVALVDVQRFLDRLTGRSDIDPVTPGASVTSTSARPFVTANGVTGVGFRLDRRSGSTPITTSTTSTLLVLSRQLDSQGTVPLYFLKERVAPGPIQPVLTSTSIFRNSSADPSLFIGSLLPSETRGFALSCDGSRAYLSLRFPGPGSLGTTFNSAIAVVGLDGPRLRLISVLEVGEELGRPFLLERASAGGRPIQPGEICSGVASRLLYIPDTRSDSIFILDGVTDQLAIAGRIPGRAPRVINDKTIRARTLSAPSQIVFTQRGMRTLGFVSNFSNSTLGVIDVSSPIPSRHCVAARIGRVLNTDGRTEGS